MDDHILGGTEGTVKSMPETAAGPASTINWRERLCEIDLSHRYFNNRPVIRLVDAETRESVAVATVDVPEVSLGVGEVLIKDYSENAGILAALEAAGIIESRGLRLGADFASLDICRLLVQPPREPAAEPEGHPADLSTGRVAFLHHLSPDGLLEDARATLVCLGEVEDRIDGLTEELRRALAEAERIRRALGEAEGTWVDLGQDRDLALREIRLASGRLASFLAEEDGNA